MLLRSEVGFSASRAVTVNETGHVGQGICLSYESQNTSTPVDCSCWHRVAREALPNFMSSVGWKKPMKSRQCAVSNVIPESKSTRVAREKRTARPPVLTCNYGVLPFM